LYGHELDRATTPLEAGLGAFVKFGRDFIGGPALLASREQGLRKRLIGVATADSRSIARQGYRVFDGNDEAGVITSGTLAPTLARPIAMAYLNAPHRPTDSLAVEIRGQRAPLTTMTLPFYRRGQTAAANRSASALLQKEP
ncbi:MAG TPA: glycine cleavage T C-terminal barrel domain-containing protein, partial [Candidatus Binataceae bacterium]|nr:glycine cleavage T C-terminal barrel domain-containing protein [Candidatus Binataceae bacterium]